MYTCIHTMCTIHCIVHIVYTSLQARGIYETIEYKHLLWPAGREHWSAQKCQHSVHTQNTKSLPNFAWQHAKHKNLFTDKSSPNFWLCECTMCTFKELFTCHESHFLGHCNLYLFFNAAGIHCLGSWINYFFNESIRNLDSINFNWISISSWSSSFTCFSWQLCCQNIASKHP